jgi:SnoaL-like protein
MTHSGGSFAERLRRLEDAEQIRQLNLEYRRHLDARDLDAYGRPFAEDGEWLAAPGTARGRRHHRDADGAAALCKLGHYDDRLIREAGRWRFLRREAPTDIG